MSDFYLGIDLGGSGLRSGLINTVGTKLLNLPEVSFEPGNLNNSNLMRLLVEKIKEAISVVGAKKITAIGIGSPGPLNPNTGIIECPPNLKVRNLPVVEILKKEFPTISSFLINDADAALLGETWKGIAREFKDIVMLTLGTGVGSSVIAGGKLQRGRGKGAEWGHTTIYANREFRPCSCRNFNCVEAFVGTEGLVKTYCRLFNVLRANMSVEDVRLTLIEFARIVNSEVKHNNFHNMADAYCLHLAEGIRNIICVHHPECIILGGGIIQNNKYLFNKVKELLNKTNNEMVGLVKGTKIGLAWLKRPGVVGAAKHAIDCYRADL
ncbi:MAG: ROK family protein [Patescibacteria group bacterium]